MIQNNTSEGADDSKNYDAVIVGGGYAGLAAMQELIEHQVQALLCESRNEPGGRTILSKKVSTQHVDVMLPAIAERGAFFVYTVEMKNRLEKAGVEVVEFPHDSFYVVSQDGHIAPPGPDGGPVDHAREVAKEIMTRKENVSYEDFFATSAAYQALSEKDRKAVYALFEADLAGPLNEVGISSAIHDAQTVGDNSADFFGVCTKGGLSTLAKSMVEKIPVESRRTSAKIRTIRVNDEDGLDFGLAGSTDGKIPPKEFHAKTGILTVPVTAINEITFTGKDGVSAPLDQVMRPDVRKALDMIGSGDVVKIGLKLKKPLVEGKSMVHISFAPPDSGPIRCASVRMLPMGNYGNAESGSQMLLMYLGGTQATDFRNFCRDLGIVKNGEKLKVIKEAAIEYLREHLGIDPDIIADDAIDISGWHPETGGRIAYSYIKADGGPVSFNPRSAFSDSVLPEGMPPLYLAGEAYSQIGATLTTGAFDSGVRAAGMVEKDVKVL